MKKTGVFLVLFSACFLFILAGLVLAQEDTGDVKAVLETAKELKAPNLPDKMKDPQWRKDHPKAVETIKDRKEDVRDRREDRRDRRR